MKNTERMNLVPHNYDLPRLENTINSKTRSECIFQPIWNVPILPNGKIPGSTLRKVKGLKSRVPKKLVNKVDFLPAIRYTLQGEINTENRLRIVKGIINVNREVSEDHFTIPKVMPLIKKNFLNIRMLFDLFSKEVKRQYTQATVGMVVTPIELQNFFKIKGIGKPDFFIIESGVKGEDGKVNVENAIDLANIKEVKAFCINAHIFVKEKEYAATFQTKPIEGFSINHGRPPIGAKPTYFNPKKELVRKKSTTRYWPNSEMIKEYGANYKLSNICPCNECEDHTAKSWFERNDQTIIDSNLRHKSGYVSERAAILQKKHLETIETIEKQLSTKIPAQVKVSIWSSPKTLAMTESAGKELSEKEVLKVLSKKETKAAELGVALRKQGYSTSQKNLGKIIRSLLLKSRIKHRLEGRDFFLSY